MGSPANPISGQQKKLEASGALEQMQGPHPTSIENGLTTIPQPQPRQRVALFRLR
jgi:hypothetical protein